MESDMAVLIGWVPLFSVEYIEHTQGTAVSIYKSDIGYWAPQAVEDTADQIILKGVLYGEMWRTWKLMLEAQKSSKMAYWFISNMSQLFYCVITALKFTNSSQRRNVIDVEITIRQVKKVAQARWLTIASAVSAIATFMTRGANDMAITLNPFNFTDNVVRIATSLETLETRKELVAELQKYAWNIWYAKEWLSANVANTITGDGTIYYTFFEENSGIYPRNYEMFINNSAIVDIGTIDFGFFGNKDINYMPPGTMGRIMTEKMDENNEPVLYYFLAVNDSDSNMVNGQAVTITGVVGTEKNPIMVVE
ncbi:MAG: hypothetical protein ACTSRA_00385 [Promethearchaeota archaeon]